VKLFLAIAFIGCAETAFAQRSTQTENLFQIPKRAVISDEQRYSVADRGRVAMAQFARCVVDRRSAQLERVLSMSIGPQYEKQLNSLATDQCLGNGKLSFNGSLFRGALFADLWRRRAAADREGQKWGPVFDPINWTTPIAADVATNAKIHLALQLYANCIIKRDRQTASEIVLLPIASKAQNEAYIRLTPNLGSCLPKDQRVKFNKPTLEGILAEALYRSPPVSVAAGAR
jgi:hypothetical protein